MHQFTSRLVICMCAIVFFNSCTHTPDIGNNMYNNRQVDSLIATGQNPNNNLDSLIFTAKKLSVISTSTGSKRALVYGELYTAQYYWLTADHKMAMEVAVKCLANAEKFNIYSVYPGIYSVMSNLHKENINYKLAFDDLEKGLRWAKANKDTAGLISVLSLKALFIHAYNKVLHKPINDTSINLQFAALKIANSKVNYVQLELPLYTNIAQYYFDNGDYNDAISYGNQGVALAVKYNKLRSLTYSFIWLGMSWYQLGDKPKGLNYLNRAVQLAHGLRQPYREMEIHEDLYHFYFSTGDYKSAIIQNMRAQQMHDSLRVNMNARLLSELQLKYESSQKDKEIATISHAKRKENKQLFVIAALGALFIIFFLILFLQYRIIWHNNHSIKKSNAKKAKALDDIAFIQSHELRKPLASILGLINVIKASDGVVDTECLNHLEAAAKDLDEKVHDVTSHTYET
jgi:tetratricopeptide (TPR) repeat protein